MKPLWITEYCHFNKYSVLPIGYFVVIDTWFWFSVIQPTGRAIQVEGGVGERRPSADIRRQRTRDSDAVIQVGKP